MQRTGFTLIELLVVVTIIAVLASLLLPSISMVRNAAVKTQCKSNQRQLVMAILGYANDFNDVAPLCHNANSPKQGNYWMRRGWQWNSGFGLLYSSGILDTRRAYYCPGMKRDPDHGEFGANNDWPPETGSTTRTSYGLRPEVGYAWDGPNPPMPRMSNYGASKSVSSCLVSTVDRVDKCHRTGVNVGYGDGHVAWVARDRFNSYLSLLTTHRSGNNWIMDAIYVAFDQAAER